MKKNQTSIDKEIETPAKTAETITIEKKPKNLVFDTRFDTFQFKEQPVSEQYILEVGKKLIEWAKVTEDALKVSQFCTLMDIHITDIARWRKRVPKMELAFRQATQIIGDRREIGGLKKNLDSGMISQTMAHYDQDWKDLAEWKSKLSKDESESKGNVTIVMERFPDSKIVPSRTPEEVATKERVRGPSTGYHKGTLQGD